MLRIRTGLLAAVLAMSILSTPAARANDYDPSYCLPSNASGTVDFTPAVELTPADNDFVIWVSCNFGGSNHNSGPYDLRLDGHTVGDSCATGADAVGNGTVTGTGPEGAVTGSFGFHREGLQYSLSGVVETGGYQHVFAFGLTMANSTYSNAASACPFDHADLSGFGFIMDIAEPPPPPAPPNGAFAAQGSGAVSPGLTLVPANQFWTMSGTWTGEFNGIPGSCSFTFNGAGAGETILSGTWSGGGGCTNPAAIPPINITCASATFTRVTLSITVTGTCTGTTSGSLTGELSMVPNSFNPTTAYSAAGWMAVA